MRIGELNQKCGRCQLAAYCSSTLSDGCLCLRPSLSGMDEQEYMEGAKATRKKMSDQYRMHIGMVKDQKESLNGRAS